MTDNLSPQMRDKILESCKFQRKENGETFVFRAMHMKYLEQILNSLTVEDAICPECKFGGECNRLECEPNKLVSVLEDAGYEVVEGYEKVKQLIQVAKSAHNLADDTCEESGVYTIPKDSFEEIGKALDGLEALTVEDESLPANFDAIVRQCMINEYESIKNQIALRKIEEYIAECIELYPDQKDRTKISISEIRYWLQQEK